MKRRKRDYKAEYARRIARGRNRGLSRSQARGHPKPTEKPVAVRRQSRLDDHRFQIALRELRDGKSLSAVARDIGVSRERLTTQLETSHVARKNGGRWIVRSDRPREMLIYSNGRASTIKVPNLKSAAKLGRYLSAVRQFLSTNDLDYLVSFTGESVADVKGKVHPFETDPNVLYRLSLTGTETFEQVYRIVV